MKQFLRRGGLLAVLLGLASFDCAQDKQKDATPAPVNAEEMAKALDDAMTPGEGQRRLEVMVGTFDAKILTWVDPSQPPYETTGTSVNSWVLGNRFVHMTLDWSIMGEPYSGIGYFGFNNVSKMYESTWMDNGYTGIVSFQGTFDASTGGTMKATAPHPLTGKPSPLELRVATDSQGNHVTELWGSGFGETMYKMMELRYTRRNQ